MAIQTKNTRRNDTTPDTFATTTSRTTSSYSPTHDQIAQRAYQLYLARGGKQGSDMQDWYQAEQELRQYTTANNNTKRTR